MTDNNSSPSEVSTLYIVPTPIGNLGDITQRAIEVLSNVDLIAAEDTRHTGKLLSHFNISTKTFALHDHNEQQKAQVLVERLQQGLSIALVSDAGTPLISDPGYHLVNQCRQYRCQSCAITWCLCCGDSIERCRAAFRSIQF